MPSAAAVSAAPPGIAEPVKVAATSLLGLQSKVHAGQPLLQATPSSSASCHGAFAVGSVYRIASKGSLKRSRGLTTYVARGVGVVVVDTATQAATFSSSFSTSYQPITPPLVVHDASHQAAFLALWPRTDDQNAELHVWSEPRDSSSSSATTLQQHHFCPIERDVTSLHPLSAREILAYHADGQVSIIAFASLQKPELHTTSTKVGKISGRSQTALFVGLLDSPAAANVLGNDAQRADHSLAVVVSAEGQTSAPASSTKRKGRKSAIEVIDAAEQSESRTTAFTATYYAVREHSEHGDAGRISVLGGADLPLTSTNTDAIPVSAKTQASLHSSGRLMLLSPDGQLTCVALRATASGVPTTKRIAGMKLNLAPAAATSILAVSASTALVACLDEARQHVHLILLDVELGSVLAEYTWKASDDCSSLFLHGLGPSSAVLLTGPSSATQGKAQTGLWSIAYEAGDGSHLRWALLSRHLTQKWLVQSNATVGKATSSSSKGGDAGTQARERLLAELQSLLKNNSDAKATAQAMSAAFDSWYNVYRPLADSSKGDDGMDLDRVEASNAAQDQDNADASASKPFHLPQTFVSALTAAALSAPSSSEAKGKPYAQSIVHALLEHKLLRNAAVPSHAVLAYLCEVGDWIAVRSALANVDDLAEDDVADVIRRVAESDSSDAPLSLDAVLSATIASNLTAAELRRALKDRLDVSHVSLITSALLRWLTPDRTQPLLVEAKSTRITDAAAQPVPSLDGTLSMAINILDTFFPVMLTAPTMLAPLTALSEAVQAHLTTVNQLAVLRGSLSAFAQLHEDRERAAENALAARMARMGGADNAADDDDDDDASRIWSTSGPDNRGGRAGKPRPGASAMVQVGGGGGLSRSGVREKTQREHRYASNVAVGLYALEEFVV